jgi:type VI secretion system protein ImpA
MPVQTTELLQPIAASKPGGDDIRYDPVFDQIKQARIEEDDLPTGDWSRARKTADYALVVRLATEVLSKRSKDLQVAVWLVEALLKREGFPGLKSGLELLTALLNDFWDHLYPEIEDDDLEYRAAPLDWVGQYLNPSVRLIPITRSGLTMQLFREAVSVGYEKDAETLDQQEARQLAVSQGKLTREEFDQAFAETPKAFYKQLIADIDAAIVALDTLDRTARDKFGDAAPRLSPLREAIGDVRSVAQGFLIEKLKLDPDPVTPTDTAAEAIDSASAVGGAAGAASVSAVIRTRSDAEGRIAAAAKFLRSENAADPAPYLLLRGFRWGELRASGGDVNPKLLAAPPTELRARLRGLLLDARWPELLELGEEVMATPFGRGWLDLQRYTLTACGGLGGDYLTVASSIQGALQALLRDLPELPTLVLMDDTPTANAETLKWLRQQNLLGSDDGAPVTAPRAPVSDGRSAGQGVYLRALEKVRSGEPEKAIEMLINQAFQERSARERFMRRSEAAQIMVDIGRAAIAMPILEDLMRDIEKHALEQWEAGETVAQPLGLLFRCLREMQGDSPDTQGLYLRICRLDPMRAMEISGSAES